MTNAMKLALLNEYRAAEGKAPFADWRNARHAPMLDAYLEAEVDAAIAAEGDATSDMGDASNIENTDDSPAPDANAEGDAGDDAGDASNAPEGEEIDEHAALDEGGAAVAEKAKVAKLPTYKQMANYEHSSIEKPVAFIHQWLANFGADLTRKQAVASLMSFGINYSTARTQYQRWFAGARNAAPAPVVENEGEGEGE